MNTFAIFIIGAVVYVSFGIALLICGPNVQLSTAIVIFTPGIVFTLMIIAKEIEDKWKNKK